MVGEGGKVDAVEHAGLDEGIDRHICEDESVANFQRFWEGVVADIVAGQTGQGAQTVGVGEFPGFAGTDYVRAVGHFQYVRHVVGSGGVHYGDGHAVLDDVQDGGYEVSRVDGHGFAGLKVNGLEIEGGLELFDELYEMIPVVVFTGDVLAAAHIDPVKVAEELAEFFGDDVEGALKNVGFLLAHGVEVQAGDLTNALLFQFLGFYAEAGVWGAGVVDLGGHFRVFGIYSYSGLNGAAGILKRRSVMTELREGIEDDVVGKFCYFLHVLVVEGRGVDVSLATEILLAESGLKKSAGAGAGEKGLEGLGGLGHGEALEGPKDLAVRFFLDFPEELAVSYEVGFRDDEDGSLQFREIF